jgi:Rad3-related DNA helicase
MDIPRLREAGRQKGFCPFFQQRKAESSSQVVIMPYNYFMDIELLKTNKFELADSVIVIDEAHNIDQQAQEGCSFSISDTELRDALREINDL